MYCNDCSRPVEYCKCGAFSRHRDSKEEALLREFFTGTKPKEEPKADVPTVSELDGTSKV